eukprot:jgi/Tetstr1/425233/TSEL_015693.t1
MPVRPRVPGPLQAAPAERSQAALGGGCRAASKESAAELSGAGWGRCLPIDSVDSPTRGLVASQVQLWEHQLRRAGESAAEEAGAAGALGPVTPEQELCRGAPGLHTPMFRPRDRAPHPLEPDAADPACGLVQQANSEAALEADVARLEACAQALLSTALEGYSTSSEASFEFEGAEDARPGVGTPIIAERRKSGHSWRPTPPSSAAPSPLHSGSSLASWRHEDEDEAGLMDAISGLVAATNALSATVARTSRGPSLSPSPSPSPRLRTSPAATEGGQQGAEQQRRAMDDSVLAPGISSGPSLSGWRGKGGAGEVPDRAAGSAGREHAGGAGAGKDWAAAAAGLAAEAEALAAQPHPFWCPRARQRTPAPAGARLRSGVAVRCAPGGGLVAAAEALVGSAAAVLAQLEEAARPRQALRVAS